MLKNGAIAADTLHEAPSGSLTYGGRVVHYGAAPGHVVDHEFPDKFGYRVFEKYVVQPDGTLKLISRRTGSDYWKIRHW